MPHLQGVCPISRAIPNGEMSSSVTKGPARPPDSPTRSTAFSQGGIRWWVLCADRLAELMRSQKGRWGRQPGVFLHHPQRPRTNGFHLPPVVAVRPISFYGW
jgi:hypothetical protein